MSNVISLTLEPSQPTDNNILSISSSDREKESSPLFSNLMEQHKEQAQSGKAKNKHGNTEHQSKHGQSKEALSAKKNNEIDQDKMNAVEKDQSNIDSTNIDSTNEDSTEGSSKITSSEVNQPEQSNKASEQSIQDKLNDNTEDLLSFLNAAENTLVTSDKKGSKTDQGVVTTTHTVKDTAPESRITNSLVSEGSADVTEASETSAKQSSSEPTFDKTLIAQSVSEKIISEQSVSKQKNTDDSALNQEIKKLLGTSKKEDANVLVQNGNSNESEITEKTTQKNIEATQSTSKTVNNVTSSAVLAKGNEQVVQNKISSSQAASVITNEEVIVEQKNILGNGLSKDNVDKFVSSKNAIQPQGEKLSTDKNTSQSKVQLSSDKMNEAAIKLNKPNDSTLSIVATEFSAKPTAESIVTVNSVLGDKNTVNKSGVLEKVNVVQNNNIPLEQDIDLVIDELSDNAESQPLNANTSVKSEANLLFDTLSQREVNKLSQQESRFVQDELSFENVIQNISADTAQMHKNTLIQQTEIISIMRKDFTDAVKDKVMVMLNQKIQQVDIQLDPPELGSMQIRVNLQNEQAVVSFIVQNQQAKEALEQNMDKLKQLMSESGVDVGEANVKQESNQSSTQEQEGNGSNMSNEEGEDKSNEQLNRSEQTKTVKASSTGVDYYA